MLVMLAFGASCGRASQLMLMMLAFGGFASGTRPS